MKLGTKLTIYLILIITIVLSGYGYFHIMMRRDILTRKMKAEVRSIGQTLKVSLEKISLPREMEFVQELIDAVAEEEKTLGVIVYHRPKEIIFKSHSLEDEVEPYLRLIQKAMEENLPSEEFGVYKKSHVFSYSFPLKDRKGRNIGGVNILQNASFVEREIRKAERDILLIIFILIAGTVSFILLGTRKWFTQPISQLIEATRELAKGNLNTQINLKRGDELSQLAEAFNQMAVDLKKAQQQIIQVAEDRLELERSLRQSEKLATIGQLASGLAHEIGTPLNIISGRVELSRRRLGDSEVLKSLDIIAQQTEKITKIIQQLLGYVRKKKIEQKPVNIVEVLEESLGFLGHQIQKQRIRVIKSHGENLPSVIGDRDQLQQVFLNLMLNALQAMSQEGTLRLSTSLKQISKEGLEESQQKYIEVIVEDSGVGMEKEVLQNIFTPFFTTKSTGSGLGLMVTQGIVQDHEGWIEVESEKGKGSVFKLYLPAYEEGKGKDE